MNEASLLIAIDALRKLRDAKAPDGIAHPDAWYEGYAKQTAACALSIIEKLASPELVYPKTENHHEDC